MAGREACVSGHVTGHVTGEAQASFAVIGTRETAGLAGSILARLCYPQDFYLVNPHVVSLPKAARTFYKSQDRAGRKTTHKHLLFLWLKIL